MVAIASAYVPSIKIDKSEIGLDDPDEKLKAIDKTLGTDCYQTKEAIKHAVTQEIDTKVIHGSGTDRSEVAGEATEFVVEAVVGTKGTGAAVKAVKGSKLANKLAQSQKLMNAMNKAKQLPKALKGIMRVKGILKCVKKYSAEDINKWWKEHGCVHPPYKPGTEVQELELLKDKKIVRVFDDENSGMKGGWMMDAKEIKGLTPNKYRKNLLYHKNRSTFVM
jgi:hypothetical protein